MDFLGGTVVGSIRVQTMESFAGFPSPIGWERVRVRVFPPFSRRAAKVFLKML
jgi:hypothetical protein